MDIELAGRRAVVTGGTGGIGAAIMAELLARGCEVIGTGISEAEIGQHRASEALAGARWCVLDVSDAAAVDSFAADIDRLDILVNCAGVTSRGPEAFSEESFLRVMDINLHGTMRMCRALLVQMERNRGTVVNVASVMSTFGSGTAPGYAASKGAVAQLTRSLAIAWAPKGIRVNAISPGWIETPMTRSAIMANDPDLYQRVKARTPMKSWGTPEHVASVVPFLCSQQAAFVTGVILPVDGGYCIS